MKPSTSAPFMDIWDWYHAGAQPISHTLKHTEKPRWLRFHSLPPSKRYAESEKEFAVILDRLNTLGDKVLGPGTDCWMVAAIWVATNEQQAAANAAWYTNHMALVSGWRLAHVQRLWSDDDELHYDIYAGRVAWSRGRFDEVLRAIAEDEVRVFWMSAYDGTIFAPYDGGVDLILPDASHIARLAAQHSDWLSDFPEGY